MIKTKYDSQYVSYFLKDNTQFYATGFRVLKKQKDKGFIPCSRINYNGKIKLLYPIEGYDSVSYAVEDWSYEETFEWILRILKVFIEVQDSGFLRMEDVDMDLSHIFVDKKMKTVHVIVLPLTTDASLNLHWESALSNTLLSLIEISRLRRYGGIHELRELIRKNSGSLISIYEALKTYAATLNVKLDTRKLKPEKPPEYVDDSTGELHLLMKYMDSLIDIAITKDIFVIGKNPKMSDGVLAISPTISRQHCCISRENEKYYIEDMKSLNHTFIDGKMLKPGEKVVIQKGMRIRLASFEFDVEFRK